MWRVKNIYPYNQDFFIEKKIMAPLYQHTNRQKIVIPQPPNLNQPWTIRLAFDGLGENPVVDATAANRALSGFNVNQDRIDFLWGTSACFFGGDASASRVYNTVNDSTLAMGSGDFTIEFWYKNYSWSTHSTYRNAVYDSYSGSNTGRMFIYHNASGKIVLWSGGSNILASNTTIQLNTWYRIALVRSSGTLKWVINGVDDSSVVNSTNFTGQGFMVGANFDYASVGGVLFKGYIDEFRMLKGTALY